MSRRNKLLSVIVLLLIAVFTYSLAITVPWAAWDYFLKYIFGGAATLVSVSGVYIAYKIQKRAEKAEAARIVLLEIRNAERTITQIKSLQGVSDFVVVLPINSWQKYQHFFVSDFNQDELELIRACFING